MSKLFPEVLPVGEARSALSSILEATRRQGIQAQPVFIGARRRPEAVLLSIELFEELLPALEDVLIAREVRQRLAEDDGTRVTHEELLAELGVDADRAR